ncbi:MAG: branched-chain amino acid ABC transporter permease [Candidatus Velthaea sp.]
MLLFLVACGLTLAFGLLRIVNLAHGALYLSGGYLALALSARGVPYWVALLAAVVFSAALGLALERGLLARIGGDELAQILVTIGVAYVVGDVIVALAGADPQTPPRPPGLEGTIAVGDGRFPAFRLALIGIGFAIFALVEGVLVATPLGRSIRAAVDDREIARTVGVRVPLLFSGVFAFGAALAGFAGVLGGAFSGLTPQSGFDILILALAVVVAGGLGSVRGAFLVALAAGTIVQFGTVYFPGFALFATYVPIVLFLSVRPRGLFGAA